MNTDTTSIQILRWSLAVLLSAAALWSFNLTAYNVWAAGFPPPSPRDVYERRAWLFLGVSLTCCASAAVVIWSLRKKKP